MNQSHHQSHTLSCCSFPTGGICIVFCGIFGEVFYIGLLKMHTTQAADNKERERETRRWSTKRRGDCLLHMHTSRKQQQRADGVRVYRVCHCPADAMHANAMDGWRLFIAVATRVRMSGTMLSWSWWRLAPHPRKPCQSDEYTYHM
jgi:hypothetical protein